MISSNFVRTISLTLWIFELSDVYHVTGSPNLYRRLHYRHASVHPDHITKQTLESQLLLNDIREAFRHLQLNKTNSNELIKSIFSQSNLNPKYIFQIPQKDNPNIIIRRTDFLSPNYPNLTTAYIKLAHLSLLSKYKDKKDSSLNQKEAEYMKESTWLTNLNLENENLDKMNNKFSDIVEENIATEKNFLNYVKKLNSKGQKYLKSPNDFSKYPVQNYKQKINNQKKPLVERKGFPKIRLALPIVRDNEWKALGLDGWEGELSLPQYNKPSFDELHVLDSNKNPKNIYEIQLPGQYDFLDNDEKNAIWDLPGKVSSEPLQQLFEKYNDENLKNMSILFTKDAKPEWPITNSRTDHKNNHIYIARSNDPFGHSTKWNLSNSSTSGIIKEDRRKRAVIELYSMIKCSTGCDPLIFKGYGCFCGFMGSGIPVDDIDRCCKIHDKCYEYSNCPSYLEYFVPYLWKCYQGKPLCAIDHGEWGGPGSCADRLCKCDLQFSRCLRKFYCPQRRAVCRTSAIRMLQNFLMIL